MLAAAASLSLAAGRSAAAFAWFVFGYLTGDGNSVVIREGTLILAICTGLCMKITDPLVDKVFRRFLERQQ